MTRCVLRLLAAALLFAASCYKDDTTSPRNGKSLARVLLTDAPFPYDSVARVNVYVASIDASSDLDTTGGGQWVRAATPARAFDVLPWLRAVTSAATGTLEGTVTTDSGGQTRPVETANITVCGSQACDPPNAYVVATGRSDAAGRYTVGFLRAGTYTVRVEQPDYPSLAPAIIPNVHIAAGDATQLPVSLPRAGSGGAYIRISGPTSVGVGGTISLRAAVGDASGNAVSNPAVSWTSSNTAIAQVSGGGDTASVMGRQAGYVTITAASGQLFDTLGVQVVGSSAPVASVTVVPGSANLAVGDSVGFRAELRDSTGTLLTDRAVSWFATDSSVMVVYPYGSQALVRPRASGSAFLRATSEGKTGQATITVH